MSPIWLLILILIVLLVLGTSIFLYVVLRRARKVSFSADPSAKAEADKKEQPPGEFLQYSSNLDLRASFRRARRLLKTYVTGKDYRYRVPWLLMTGESESGKTTILEGNGTNLSLNGSGGDDQQLNWYFFNEGVVIDVAGDFVLRADGTANHRGWNTISRLLQKHRPRRPLDGVVLTIPCTDLVGAVELNNERRFQLEQKAICFYKKLWQSQRILGMRLPVYVLVTKCDEVTGFTGFSNQLPDRLQTQMFESFHLRDRVQT
jgi:type VI secretion system protein ImpL